MPARSVVLLVVVAGTLVPATAASAQLPTTTTTIELPITTTTTEAATTTTSTTSTTAAPATTTTEAEDEEATTTTTEADEEEELDALDGGGGLTISVPPAATAAGTVGGASATQLGPVTVSDDRLGLVAGWTAVVTASDFVSGGGTPAETIPRTSLAYWSGPATATTGAAMFLPGQATAGQAEGLEVPRNAFAAVTTSGGTSATWNPTLVVAPPVTAVSGTYQGTITHSVA